MPFQELSIGQFHPGGNLGEPPYAEPRFQVLQLDAVSFFVKLIGVPRLLERDALHSFLEFEPPHFQSLRLQGG